MDFGLTDDQRDIQRTARDLLAERASARARARARRGRHAPTTALWQELRELGWPGIAVAEEHGGQGLGGSSWRSSARSSAARRARPVPADARWPPTLIEHAGSDEQRARWLPGLAERRARRRAGHGARRRRRAVLGGADADVIVLVDEDGTARVLARAEAEVEPLAGDRPDPPGAPACAASGAGEAAARRRRRAAWTARSSPSAPSSSASATARWR